MRPNGSLPSADDPDDEPTKRPKKAPSKIYKLKFERTEPPILRRVLVRSEISFAGLVRARLAVCGVTART